LTKELHVVFEKRGRDDDASLSKAYSQIRLSGSLLGSSDIHDFSNFRLELMDKKSNSTGLQIADLTARPIGNHYLHASGQKEKTDQRAAKIILKNKYDVFHDGL